MSDNDTKNDQMRSSRPAIIKTVLLQSEQAQNVYRKSFRQLDRHTFSISIISRARMHQDKAEKAEWAISEIFAEVNDDLELHIDRLTHLYQKLAIKEQSVMSNPLSVKAKITTRLSLEFLGLVEKLDHFLCMFEPLVILGQISYEQRQTVTFQWQDRLNKLSTNVRIKSQEIREWHTAQKDSQQTLKENSGIQR
ncbi:hypothetical protein MNBD_GAMMA12-520 [hydrothermal vent metagenome]|uniref:DUF1845 domain-containing protein n=1 Tax=hydrothermal vent metagenome TaxID=652676 RepID=A0A3B0XXL8_9ZZZZ